MKFRFESNRHGAARRSNENTSLRIAAPAAHPSVDRDAGAIQDGDYRIPRKQFATNDGLDPLISEDAIVAVDNRFLLVANPGSNSISALRIDPDFSLTLIGTVPTGGVGPDSIAYRNGLVYYVANADSDGTFTGALSSLQKTTGLLLLPLTNLAGLVSVDRPLP